MAILVIGLILFLGAHSTSIIAHEHWRDRMVARIGEGPWRGLYSLVSLAGFALIIWGYGTARHEGPMLYAPPSPRLAVLLMAPVFPLLLATYLPGQIQRAAQHPMLLAVMLWSLAHLLASGSPAGVLLFGSFFLWSAADRVSMNYRTQRPIHRRRPSRWNDTIALAAGLVLYLAFLAGVHHWLFGVSPLP